MLLWGCLLNLLLLAVVSFSVLLLWCVLLLLFLWCFLVATVSRTTAHHSSYTLVSNLTTGSECHTSCHGAHKTTSTESHAAGLLLLLWWGCLSWSWCWSWCSSC